MVSVSSARVEAFLFTSLNSSVITCSALLISIPQIPAERHRQRHSQTSSSPTLFQLIWNPTCSVYLLCKRILCTHDTPPFSSLLLRDLSFDTQHITERVRFLTSISVMLQLMTPKQTHTFTIIRIFSDGNRCWARCVWSFIAAGLRLWQQGSVVESTHCSSRS